MKKAGQVVVFRFPQTDLEEGKLRPALLLGKLPGEYDDWLICMISSQTHQYITGFDENVNDSDEDFEQSGLADWKHCLRGKRVKSYKRNSSWTISSCVR